MPQEPSLNKTLCAVFLVLVAIIPTASSQTVREQVPPASVEATPISIHNGFLTGQQFRELQEIQKRSYAEGIIDGMFLAHFLVHQSRG